MKDSKARNKRIAIQFGVIAAVFIAAIVLYFLYEQFSKKKKAEISVEQTVEYIRSEIENAGEYSEVLTAWLDVEGDSFKEAIAEGEDDDAGEAFEKIASAVYDEDKMTSVQLIPNGVIRYVYPKENNERLLNSDITKSDEAQLLEKAAEEKTMVITGPAFVLKEGFGLNYRNPVYYEDGSLWGFTSITLKLPEALQPFGLEHLTLHGYEYDLRYIADESTKKIKTIDSTIAVLYDTVDCEFKIQDTTWILSIRPPEGWMNYGRMFICIVVSIMLALILSWALTFWKENQAKAMGKLQSDAKHDKMTGLLNHTASAEAINNALEQVEGGVLLLIDVDNFKTVNDTAGHLAGDEVLVEVANAMRTTFRRYDILGRYGGDEFIIYMIGDISIPDFSVKASQFQRKIRKIQIGDTGKYITCSIGGARRCVETPDAEALVKRADQALYTSKGNGKDRFTIYDDSDSTLVVTPKEEEKKINQDFTVHE